MNVVPVMISATTPHPLPLPRPAHAVILSLHSANQDFTLSSSIFNYFKAIDWSV